MLCQAITVRGTKIRVAVIGIPSIAVAGSVSCFVGKNLSLRRDVSVCELRLSVKALDGFGVGVFRRRAWSGLKY